MATAEGTQKMKVFPWWLVLIEGILAILLGLMFLAWPAKTFVAFTFFIGIYWFISGIFDIVSIFIDKSMWGWKLVMGIIGIVAGIFLFQQPVQGAIALGTTTVILVGFMGLFYGILGLVRAFQGGGWGAGLMGIVSMLLGIYMLSNFWATALALPWVFGFLAIFGGIAAIAMAFRMK